MRTPLLDLARPGFSRLCRAYFGLELSGIANLPTSGPLIITPNHQTYADPAKAELVKSYLGYAASAEGQAAAARAAGSAPLSSDLQAQVKAALESVR